MGGVIVEQEANQQAHRVIRVEPFKKGNDLTAAMPLGHDVVHDAVHQIGRSWVR